MPRAHGGAHAQARGESASTLRRRPSGRQRTFKLANKTKVTASLPRQPIGSTGASTTGVTLDLYLAQRQTTGAVLVVYALNLNAAGVYSARQDASWPADDLSSNAVDPSGTNTVSNTALLDPTALKEYQTFMANPNEDTTCLCSIAQDQEPDSFWHQGSYYYAAVVAAPPADDNTVTLVTGLGSIGDVNLSQ